MHLVRSHLIWPHAVPGVIAGNSGSHKDCEVNESGRARPVHVNLQPESSYAGLAANIRVPHTSRKCAPPCLLGRDAQPVHVAHRSPLGLPMKEDAMPVASVRPSARMRTLQIVAPGKDDESCEGRLPVQRRPSTRSCQISAKPGHDSKKRHHNSVSAVVGNAIAISFRSKPPKQWFSPC